MTSMTSVTSVTSYDEYAFLYKVVAREALTLNMRMIEQTLHL